MSNEIKIGTGIILKRGNKFLLGFNVKKNTWTLIGGKSEPGESIFECIKRETLEECGINIIEADIVSVEDKNEEGFLTIGLLSENFQGEPKLVEPHKISKLEWFDFDKLPTPLFSSSALVIKHYLEGRVY